MGLRGFGMLAALVALVIVGAASAAQSASPLARSSTFDSNAEGWVVLNDSGFGNAGWQSSGGNPGGYITAQFNPPYFGVFQSTGSGNGGTWNSGNALGDYGGTLKVDIQATDANSDAYYGFFSSNSSVIPCNEAGVVGTSWDTYSVPLDTGDLFDCAKVMQCTTPICIQAAQLTGAQVSAALAGFEAMVVFPLDIDSAPDTVNLDNAALAGPQVAVTPPAGKVMRTLTLGPYRRGKITGTIIAGDDYSCAGKETVTIFRKAKKPVKVGTTKTSAPNLQKEDGPATFSFKLKKPVKGSYYASATKATSRLDGNSCNAVTSKTVRAH
jgi:hypothetical protein